MYDRFFAKLKSKPIIIFVQLDYCFTKTIVSEVFDIQADIVVAGKYNKIIRK
jgi:5-formyltetrahydrofolate cyclo-ligase